MSKLEKVKEALEQAKWQGMDTAPKDSSMFLAYSKFYDVQVLCYFNERLKTYQGANATWSLIPANKLTHWMPLPEPPKDSE